MGMPVAENSKGKKSISYSNLLVGAALNMFEVSTLGQPLEVTKTQMAANRSQTIVQAGRAIWGRGGVLGFYQGLIPWAWIEASTKGAVLLFAASEIEYASKSAGLNGFWAGLLGGMGGGLAQAYTTMGVATTMKTAEITRQKASAKGQKPPGTMEVFANIWKNEGIRGINKGVNAVALRQCTNWGSRMALSRLAESTIRSLTGKSDAKSQPLSAWEKILASTIGGGLSCWNQPFEVVRVEMQSMKADPNRPKGLSVLGTAKYVYSEGGVKALYRGVTPRIGLGIWQTICMVTFADYAKAFISRKTNKGS